MDMPSAYHILVVDDDSQSLEVLVRVLQREGYDTVTASDAHTAQEVARTHSLDLAILDFNLPDGTGVQVLQQIRLTHPSIPILIMSADERNLIPAADAGAYSFIRKPANLNVLRNVVSRALTRRPPEMLSHEIHSSVRIQRGSVWVRWSRRIVWWKSIK